MTDFMSPGIISDAIRTVFTFFDTIFFGLLQGVYQVFFNVSTAELFSNPLIRDFYYRCQLVIGVFMLFKLSVTILEGIMDPARITDKKAGAGKIISRIITSLVILALITPINIPSPQNKWERQVNNNGLLFGALYSLQERILSNNTIGKLVLGTTDGVTDADEQGQTLSESAKQFAGQILRGFFRINVVPEPDDGYDVETGQDPEVNKDYRFCDFTEEQEQFYITATPAELLSAVNDTCEIDSNSSWFQELGEKISSILFGKETYYRYSYSPIAGIVALIISVILILYTIDVAIRALKLAILRLIAPIPIISHMSISAKEGKGEDAFSSWVRSLTSTYLELFIRLAIMYFVIYLIHDMIANGIVINTGTGMVGILSFVFIVIGIFIFARMAPRFIENSLGIKGMGGSIGLAMGLSAAGTLRAGGTFGDAFNAARDSVDTNVNAYNSGKAAPGLADSYNSGRDLAAKMITGDDKMTYNQMRRGRSILAREGITPNIAKDYKNDMKLQSSILQGMEDAKKVGATNGLYTVYYQDSNGTTVSKQVREDEFDRKLAEQRAYAAASESAYNDIASEQKRFGQTVGYREKAKGRRHPYTSARRQDRAVPQARENYHDNRAIEFNGNNGVDPVIGDRL